MKPIFRPTHSSRENRNIASAPRFQNRMTSSLSMSRMASVVSSRRSSSEMSPSPMAIPSEPRANRALPEGASPVPAPAPRRPRAPSAKDGEVAGAIS